MFILHGMTYLFLLPGDIVLKLMKITPDEDGGILRSFINMIFWGVAMSVFAIKVFV